MIPAWVVPTGRAIAWTPLAAVAAWLLVGTAAAAAVDVWPVSLLGLVAAAVAAALVAGMHDPAAALLAAVPVSAAVRRARRLLLLVPVAAATWAGWLAAGHRWAPEVGWPVVGVGALTATALAVSVWAPAPYGTAAGVATPLLWALAAWAGDLDWDRGAVEVTALALIALWTGRNR